MMTETIHLLASVFRKEGSNFENYEFVQKEVLVFRKLRPHNLRTFIHSELVYQQQQQQSSFISLLCLSSI